MQKKPVFAIAVKMGGQKIPPKYSEKRPEAASAPAMGSETSERNHEQERPEDESAFHERGEAPRPTPESVRYHSAADVCGACEYMNGGNCLFLNMPVDDGGHCERFEGKQQDEISPNGGAEQAEAM